MGNPAIPSTFRSFFTRTPGSRPSASHPAQCICAKTSLRCGGAPPPDPALFPMEIRSQFSTKTRTSTLLLRNTGSLTRWFLHPESRASNASSPSWGEQFAGHANGEPRAVKWISSPPPSLMLGRALDQRRRLESLHRARHSVRIVYVGRSSHFRRLSSRISTRFG